MTRLRQVLEGAALQVAMHVVGLCLVVHVYRSPAAPRRSTRTATARGRAPTEETHTEDSMDESKQWTAWRRLQAAQRRQRARQTATAGLAALLAGGAWMVVAWAFIDHLVGGGP